MFNSLHADWAALKWAFEMNKADLAHLLVQGPLYNQLVNTAAEAATI
jgi:hypothetical protein